MPPFSFSVCIYFVAIKRKQLAKIYAAKFLACNDVLWVAEELFSIMEESMTYDSSAKQEVTKEFLVDIIEVMSAVDEEYTLQITDEYLKLALESKTGNKK
ncbi:hypothetical protein [Acinetobacter sp. UBA6526]|uniref:hypothetical protein n=1 Tax=Acinetobacter sp. UBA6526 TaxID=1945950 RepID=UPI002580D7BE|nr:hypothetical protein [Acinetobacter sp. UBA6526]